MKSTNFLITFVIALIALLTLQTMWLYNSYLIQLKETKDAINEILLSSVDKELDYRFIESNKKEKKDIPHDEVIYEFDSEKIEDGNGLKSQQYEFMQYLMSINNIPFDLNVLDTIFQSALIEENIRAKYQLNFTDSLNNIITSAGQKINRGFETEIISIINGNKVQAIINISPPVIFRNMLGILIISILILLFIIGCLIFEIKVFRKQYKLNQLRDNFINALIHDMKTPLGTIHAALNLWGKGILDQLPEKREEFCSVATEQVLNLQALTDQILSIAKAEQNQLILNIQAIDLPAMIESLIKKFMLKGGKTIEFETQYDLKDVVVCADPFHLNNAISNLIDNAIKYSGESVWITIDCSAGEKQVFIRVRDNGWGISEKDQQKIFERFERGAEIKRNIVRGFGLGLNYVKQVITAHKGTIALSSMQKQGSEFVITVPIQLTSIENEFVTMTE